MEVNAVIKTEQDELLDAVTRRATALYEAQLKAQMERDHRGRIVVIHPDSGEHVVADTEEEAVRRLRARQPGGLLFVRRIGPPTPGDLRFAVRLADSSPGK